MPTLDLVSGEPVNTTLSPLENGIINRLGNDVINRELRPDGNFGESFDEREDLDVDEDFDIGTGTEVSNYEELKSLATFWRKKDDNSCYKVGDIALRVVQLLERARERIGWANDSHEQADPDDVEIARLGDKILNQFADDIGVKRDHLIAQKRVAEVFPDGHWIRNSRLTFSHARALYPLESTDEREEWARRALDENLSVTSLWDLLRAQREQASVESGDVTCFYCNHTVGAVEDLIKLRHGKDKYNLHAWGCLALFAANMDAASHGQTPSALAAETVLPDLSAVVIPGDSPLNTELMAASLDELDEEGFPDV